MPHVLHGLVSRMRDVQGMSQLQHDTRAVAGVARRKLVPTQKGKSDRRHEHADQKTADEDGSCFAHGFATYHNANRVRVRVCLL